jgi:NAD(P)-dependent dehydrogenase (short-subunit alcohol dehydrogenase family)
MSQVAVVTGGNRGIGYEIARSCVRAGFKVVLAARNEANGQAAARDLGCEFVKLDLDDAGSISACASEVQRRHGQIDVLINNAARAYKHADQTAWTTKTRTTVKTNFFGTLAVCEAFLPLIKPGGRLVNVASMAGHLRILPSQVLLQEFASADTSLTKQRLAELMAQFIQDVEACPSTASAPGPDWPHVAKGWPSNSYGMSKLGEIALTKIYARELRSRGISANCCCPGSVATDMNPRGSLTPAQGADTPVWLAVQTAEAATGQFFKQRTPVRW